MAHADVGDDFARLDPLVTKLDVRAHRLERFVKAGPQRIDDHAAGDDVRTRHNRRGDQRESSRGWIGANAQLGACKVPPPSELNDPAFRRVVHRDFAAELAQHDLAMIARRTWVR